jgi:hypothetical protein
VIRWRPSEIHFYAVCDRRRAERDCSVPYAVSKNDDNSFWVVAFMDAHGVKTKQESIARVATRFEDVESWRDSFPEGLGDSVECGCRRLVELRQTPLTLLLRCVRPVVDVLTQLWLSRPFKPDYGLSRAMRYERGIPLPERER